MPETSFEETRLHFLVPRYMPPEGVSVLPIDLTAFFVTVRRVGRNPGLLLLTMRALRQRTGFSSVRIGDLSWILRTTGFTVGRWLEQLSRHGLVVYDLTGGSARDAVVVEIVTESPDLSAGTGTPAASGPAHHELPTHWFVHVLPRVGRTTFLVYLRLLAFEGTADGRPVLVVEHLASDLGLLGTMHARLHLRRLRRHRLLREGRDGGLVVLDPPPLGLVARVFLRLRAASLVPRSVGWRLVLLLAVLVPLAVLAYLLTHRLP